MTAAPPFSRRVTDVLLHVRLTPKGGRDAIDGIARSDDGKAVLLARVRALPEDGAANAALIALIAKTIKIPKSAITLENGGKSRVKTLAISGDLDAIEARLAAFAD